MSSLNVQVPGLRLARRTKPAEPYCKELQGVLDDMRAGTYGPMDEASRLVQWVASLLFV